MVVELKARTGESEITIPAWLWAGTGTILLLLVGGLGTWVGATLLDHDRRITVTESKIDGIDKSITRIELTVEKVDTKIDKLLDRLSDGKNNKP